MTVRRKVVRVTQSPMNALRWALDLECGHEVWVTSKSRPKRATGECSTCVSRTLPPKLTKRECAIAAAHTVAGTPTAKAAFKCEFCGLENDDPNPPEICPECQHGGTFVPNE